MANLQDLQAQLASLEEQRADLYGQSSVDQTAVAAINEQIKEVQALIAVAEQEQQVQAAHQERMEAAAVEISNAIEFVKMANGVTFPLRSLIPEEADYQIVLIHFNEQFVAQADKYSRQIQQVESSYQRQLTSKEGELTSKDDELNQLKLQIAQMQQREADLNAKLNAAEVERDNAKASSADFEQKLKNAAGEIDRLNSHIDDLRNEIAVGAKEAIKVVTTEDAAEEKRKWMESRKIYDKRWKDGAVNKTYIANLASTGEEVEIPYYAINSWVEVTQEEAARFRSEQPAVATNEAESVPAAETNDIPDSTLGVGLTPPQVPPFQTEETTADGLDGDSTVSESNEQGPVTREEFEALKRDVEALKQASVGAAA